MTFGRNRSALTRMLNSVSVGPSAVDERVRAMLAEDMDLLQNETSGETLADIWADGVRRCLELASESMFDELFQHEDELEFSITDVYSEREIHGIVKEGKQKASVFLSVDNVLLGQIPDIGCTLCKYPAGELCYHALGFTDFVFDQLDRGRSKLRTKINNKRFKEGRPDHLPFRPDPTDTILAELRSLASRMPATDREDASALPVIDAALEQRLCWAFSSSDGHMNVTPLLQQRKKRGSGFTKGKKLSLAKLIQDRQLPVSAADSDVIDQVKQVDTYYYREKEYYLSSVVALEKLVGQTNVIFNEQPCVIERRAPLIRLRDDDDGQSMSFRLINPWCSENQLVSTHENACFAFLDLQSSRVGISSVGEHCIKAIHTLLRTAPFPNDRAAKVVAQLKPFFPLLSIELPESIGGPVTSETATPVVILRSRSDGKLDFGIRVRTGSGQIKLPGAAPLIRADKIDKKAVQLRRDADAEKESASRLLRKLDLPTQHHGDSSTWNGTIDDFQVALRVVDRLQADPTGTEVLWDKNSEKPIKVLGSLSSRNVRVDITSKRNWFGVTGQCVFDNQTIPLDQLLFGLQSDDQRSGDFVRLASGDWAKISDKLQQQLKQLRDATHSDRKTLKLDATAAPAIRDLIDDDVEVKATKAWEKCLKRFANAEKLQPTVPANQDAELRDYQVDGYKWLSRLAAWGVGGILADDMGLGKTLQTLAVLLDRSDDGPALVIAPTSVGFNWLREAERFAPDLDVHLYRETDRAEFLSSVGPKTVVICSYALALRDAEPLAQVKWHSMVLDEAQAIKNSRSKTSRAIAAIDADWTVALTGTPVENHLGELWSLFHVVSPGVFGGWEAFRNRFAGPIEKQGDQDAQKSLAARIQPFVFRRTKSQVLTELPPRTEMNLYVDLSPAERQEYEKVRLAAIGELEQIESLPDIQDQRFRILAMMTRLRQISCHAGLVKKEWDQSSAKLDQLCETLESLREEGHRALIFSQFTSHLALIRDALNKKGFSYEYLDGSTPAGARQEAVDRFQNGDANAFLISLKAGGTGLNLTAADYVIHMDPWWNPAVEDQATDRAHRFGQDKPVMVYRIVARGTIEEEILSLHDSKRDLVAGVMQGTQAAAKLTNDDLIRMMKG